MRKLLGWYLKWVIVSGIIAVPAHLIFRWDYSHTWAGVFVLFMVCFRALDLVVVWALAKQKGISMREMRSLVRRFGKEKAANMSAIDAQARLIAIEAMNIP